MLNRGNYCIKKEPFYAGDYHPSEFLDLVIKEYQEINNTDSYPILFFEQEDENKYCCYELGDSENIYTGYMYICAEEDSNSNLLDKLNKFCTSYISKTYK